MIQFVYHDDTDLSDATTMAYTRPGYIKNFIR